MWKYNYHREHIGDAGLAERLNELGEAHWDLRFIERVVGRDQTVYWDCLFKRTHTELLVVGRCIGNR